MNYQPLVPPQPTNTSAEQVEVLEMFGYGCPHCAALEPFMDELAEEQARLRQVRADPRLGRG